MRHITLEERASASPAVDAGRARPVGVLVIEDDRLMRKALEEGLRTRGFAVWAASDGGEGVEVYHRHQGRIDVVLSDVTMPVVSGPQALDALRAINPLVRFCFMTADARLVTVAELLGRGALRVFTKPFPSVAEVAEELWVLATRPRDESARVELGGGEEVVLDDAAPSGPRKQPPAGGFFGTLFRLAARSAAGLGLPWGGSPSRPPSVAP